jgi:hypothetical protein
MPSSRLLSCQPTADLVSRPLGRESRKSSLLGMRSISCVQTVLSAPVIVWVNTRTFAQDGYVFAVQCINTRVYAPVVRTLLATLSTQNNTVLSLLSVNFSTQSTALTIMAINKPNLITVGV